MANTDWNERIREEVEAIKSGGRPAQTQEPVCQAADLKGLLNTIVEQISDADRRHTDTLVQMQDRLASMGREASTLRSKVPPQFASAFERIEAGMSDLARQIADAGELRATRVEASEAYVAHHETETDQAAQIVPAANPERSAPQFAGEPPMALRTAGDGVAQAARSREDFKARHGDIDPFDVIETSLPGNVSDPWDRNSAEALAGIYEQPVDPYSASPAPAEGSAHRSYAAPASMAMAPAAGAIDHNWLEARFAEITQRIDQSLADIRPDQAFFALNQRVNELENHFTGLIEGVATRGDVEGIRLIEAHMSELATHLEGAHNQLLRLDAIENQLVAVAGKLDEVHQIASSDASGAGGAGDGVSALMPQFDIEAVAKAAANEAASRFADLKPAADPSQAIEGVHALIERFMNDAKQGEENTSALLDTLQQAMIRLLDRVDFIELTQQQAIQAQSAPQEYVREQVRFNVDPGRAGYAAPQDSHQVQAQALDAAVAAVASAKQMSTPFAHAPGSEMTDAGEPMEYAQPQAAAAAAPRGPEKIRQDFIADARRAKLRLAAAEGGDAEGGVIIAKPDLSERPLEKPAAGKVEKAAGKSKGKPKADGNAQQSMPRLMVMGLGVIALLGGLWYIMQGGGGGAPEMASPAAITAPVAGQLPAGDAKGALDAPAGDAGTQVPSNERSDLTPGQTGTIGEILTGEIIEGETSVPLGGVAIDTGRPVAAADLQRAKRQQAMAAMSSKIGQAAASGQTISPAALIPDAAADAAAGQGVTAVEKNSITRRGALDMPPVTVGPLSLRLAAANGDPSAEFEVGARLAEGKGTSQSFEEAAKWYQRSADQGFVQSQYRLGTFYERGLGVKADPAKAAAWYQRAAEKGNVKAMHNLAVLSANQSKGSPDYATAAKWFTEAAERNLSDSQFNLAVLYENGLGVEQNLKQSFKWLSLAAKSGDKEAVRRRDILKGKLTAEEIAEAEAMLKTYSGKVPDPMANDARSAGEAWKKNPANGVNG